MRKSKIKYRQRQAQMLKSCELLLLGADFKSSQIKSADQQLVETWIVAVHLIVYSLFTTTSQRIPFNLTFRLFTSGTISSQSYTGMKETTNKMYLSFQNLTQIVKSDES